MLIEAVFRLDLDVWYVWRWDVENFFYDLDLEVLSIVVCI